MNTPTPSVQQSWIEILWALVILQGGILVLSTLEALFVNALFGFSVVMILILTAAGAVLTLRTARGLRLRERWARRVTLVAEWFVLVTGLLEVAATILLPGASTGIVPILTRIVIPVAVLIFLRRTKSQFVTEPDAETPELADEPADDPVLGVLV
ncbi:MAG: hypothetical protein ACR2NG_00860 [Acidimicrobiia bacterium]